MSHFRKIDVRIWNDAKFRSLSEAGKLCFFMLLTHPMMTALGAMRGTFHGLASEISADPEPFREGFRQLLSKGMAEADEEGVLIALPNFLKYNPPANPNVVKAWEKSLEFLPECPLKTVVIQRAKSFVEGLGKPFAQALPKPFRDTESREKRAEREEPSQGRADLTGSSAGEMTRRPTLAQIKGNAEVAQ
jgi:hypothetical protein